MRMPSYTFEQRKKDPSNKYFIKQMLKKHEVIFQLYDKEVRGQITNFKIFDVFLEGLEEPIRKETILYVYKPDSESEIKAHIIMDEKVVAENLGPAMRPTERLAYDNELPPVLQENKTVLTITMRNGHVFTGKIHTFGPYCIRLDIGKNKRVLLFRHSMKYLSYKDQDGKLVFIDELYTQGSVKRWHYKKRKVEPPVKMNRILKKSLSELNPGQYIVSSAMEDGKPVLEIRVPDSEELEGLWKYLVDNKLNTKTVYVYANKYSYQNKHKLEEQNTKQKTENNVPDNDASEPEPGNK